MQFVLLCLYDCNFSLRACAAAALKDVTAYFTQEQGQVAVSKRTTGTVPLITLNTLILVVDDVCYSSLLLINALPH